MHNSYTRGRILRCATGAYELVSRTVQPRGDRRGIDDGRGRLPADVVEAHEGEAAAGRVLAEAVAEREEEAIYNFFQKSTARATTPGLGIQKLMTIPCGRRESALVKVAPESVAEDTDPTTRVFCRSIQFT